MDSSRAVVPLGGLLSSGTGSVLSSSARLASRLPAAQQDSEDPDASCSRRLGATGMALQYANVINMIDALVSLLCIHTAMFIHVQQCPYAYRYVSFHTAVSKHIRYSMVYIHPGMLRVSFMPPGRRGTGCKALRGYCLLGCFSHGTTEYRSPQGITLSFLLG